MKPLGLVKTLWRHGRTYLVQCMKMTRGAAANQVNKGLCAWVFCSHDEYSRHANCWVPCGLSGGILEEQSITTFKTTRNQLSRGVLNRGGGDWVQITLKDSHQVGVAFTKGPWCREVGILHAVICTRQLIVPNSGNWTPNKTRKRRRMSR